MVLTTPTSISTVTPRQALAIAEVASYAVLLLVLSFLIGRDADLTRVTRSRRQTAFAFTWIPLLLFLILRILTGALYITTIGNPSPFTLQVASAVCFSIGLPLLLIATLELLDRVNVYAARGHYNHVPFFTVTRVQQFVLLVALVLFAVAGARAGDVYSATGRALYPIAGILNKVAIILTLIIFATIVLGSLVIAVLNLVKGFVREKALFFGIVVALPFEAVRLVYGILGHLVGQDQANPIYGNLGLFIGLGFVMEVLAVIFLLAGGLGNLHSRRERLRRFGPGSRSSGRSIRRARTATTSSSSRGTETGSDEIIEVVSERRSRRG